ncbi:MAG: hypothetical protein M0R75_07045 [Dehalococcoidia bacterium]|nr:hypothetical protein [Dehalococcoidia bacterium]
MAWLRIDDRMPRSAKLMGLTDRVKWAYVASMCYASEEETDGAIPSGVQREMGWTRVRKDLIEAGLWHEKPCGEGACQETERQREKLAKGGHVVHDYLEYNPTHEELEEKRAKARDRMAENRGKRAAKSSDVRDTFARTSGEVPAKFEESSPYPPSPSPSPDQRSDPERAYARMGAGAESERVSEPARGTRPAHMGSWTADDLENAPVDPSDLPESR